MWRSITVLASCLFACCLMTAPAMAKKLPCGDYDGVPSHNDCAPVGAELQAKCQKWITKGNATYDPATKEKYKKKYIHCVD